MEGLQKQLEEERLDRQREVAELERRNVAAKDKLKSEMFEKIKETKTVWRRHGGAFCLRACVCLNVRDTQPTLRTHKSHRAARAPPPQNSQSILLATSDQLHYTTKRTMVENEQMTSELTYQSKEAERVVQANKKLMKDNADLRREIEVCRCPAPPPGMCTCAFVQISLGLRVCACMRVCACVCVCAVCMCV